MGNTEIVVTFCKDLEKRILVENKVRLEKAGDSAAVPEAGDNKVSPAPELTKLSQVSPGQASQSMVA